MIIDAHTHSFERLMGFGPRGEVNPVGFGKVRFGTGEEEQLMPPALVDSAFPGDVVLAYMDWMNVSKTVLLQGNLYGFHNDYDASLVRRWPDRFLGCAYVDPMLSGAVKILRHLMEDLGYKALKLELTELTGVHTEMKLNAPSLKEFWKCFSGYEATLVVDIGTIGERSYQLDELGEVLSSHPTIGPVVIPHIGGASLKVATDPQVEALWQKFLSMAKDFGFYVDTASLPFGSYEEYPCPIVQRLIERTVGALGAEKILWGSDMPSALCKFTYRQVIDLVREHCQFLSPREKELVLGENALKAFQFV